MKYAPNVIYTLADGMGCGDISALKKMPLPDPGQQNNGLPFRDTVQRLEEEE